jgi:molecular chaperone GrpE
MSKDDILEDESEIKDKATREESGVEAVPLPAPTAEEADAMRREVADLRDQLLRRRADFENYRRRVERDREQAAIEAKAQVLAGLLPSLDNLERALEAAATAPAEAKPLKDGVELVYRNLLAYLESQGVLMKDPTGEMFDPNIHQALMHEPVPGFADGTIVEVFRKAYFLKDRLLRPALVKVAKGESDQGLKH